MTRQSDDARPPWKRSNPKKKSGAKPRTLSKAKIAEARARARSAGRPYPNLIDNMAVARKGSSKKKQGAVRKRSGTGKKKSGVKRNGASSRRVKKSG
jgi:hypothetical protein